MTENPSNQEILRVTVNGNCSFFVPDTFEHYLYELKEHTDRHRESSPSPYDTLRLEGYADYSLMKKSEVRCKVTDCIQVAQFRLPN